MKRSTAMPTESELNAQATNARRAAEHLSIEDGLVQFELPPRDSSSLEELAGLVRRHPITALIVAAGAGLVLGKLVRQ
jgi:ElaB/YqjD/DUF883 family membrane-anchored ribosome-binding protein